mmetsp:Transcript_47597/g.147158  ORF Transcript_47597/g.147158 Transcript_47597/m.147158 type:complete len:391 (-) Transcript_47597:601-1773(-)
MQHRRRREVGASGPTGGPVEAGRVPEAAARGRADPILPHYGPQGGRHNGLVRIHAAPRQGGVARGYRPCNGLLRPTHRLDLPRQQAVGIRLREHIERRRPARGERGLAGVARAGVGRAHRGPPRPRGLLCRALARVRGRGRLLRPAGERRPAGHALHRGPAGGMVGQGGCVAAPLVREPRGDRQDHRSPQRGGVARRLPPDDRVPGERGGALPDLERESRPRPHRRGLGLRGVSAPDLAGRRRAQGAAGVGPLREVGAGQPEQAGGTLQSLWRQRWRVSRPSRGELRGQGQGRLGVPFLAQPRGHGSMPAAGGDQQRTRGSEAEPSGEGFPTAGRSRAHPTRPAHWSLWIGQDDAPVGPRRAHPQQRGLRDQGRPSEGGRHEGHDRREAW